MKKSIGLVFSLLGKVIFSVLIAGMYVFTIWVLFFDWIEGFRTKKKKKK